jgi:hypothetical protein
LHSSSIYHSSFELQLIKLILPIRCRADSRVRVSQFGTSSCYFELFNCATHNKTGIAIEAIARLLTTKETNHGAQVCTTDQRTVSLFCLCPAVTKHSLVSPTAWVCFLL